MDRELVGHKCVHALERGVRSRCGLVVSATRLLVATDLLRRHS